MTSGQTSEFSGDGALLHSQRWQTVRNMPIAQADFCLRTRVHMVGLGSGSYSIVLNPNDPDKVDIFCRSRSQLEDKVEARKDCRARQRSSRESCVSSSHYKDCETVAERTWTRRELVMCEQTQRELEANEHEQHEYRTAHQKVFAREGMGGCF